MISPSNNLEITQKINDQIIKDSIQAIANLDWLTTEMHPLFFSLNQDDIVAFSALSTSLHHMNRHNRIMLLDTPKRTILAQLGTHGSLYKALQNLPINEISYAELTTSNSSLPNNDHKLEVLRFDYERKQDHEIAALFTKIKLSEDLYSDVSEVLKGQYPEFKSDNIRSLLKVLWCNNQEYIQVSHPNRVARILKLYAETILNDGIFLDLEATNNPSQPEECRLLLGLANPPVKAYLLQLIGVLDRLGISVNRSYSLTLSNGVHPYFLSTFYVTPRDGSTLVKGSDLYLELQREIYNTQILSPDSNSYIKLVKKGLTTGSDASLTDAMISFCHTNLAHNHPDSYSMEGIMRAFHNHPDITTQLLALFHYKFTPDMNKKLNKEEHYQEKYDVVFLAVENFNTGRKFLDNFRRTMFQCALYFIKHTLKTNFFVAEKHALSFRLNPLYLDDLGEHFTSDLPADRPFRITFFFGRNGIGYHIGFSDIARGGWRTIITQGRDDYITNADTMFRENYVLAHTQHLKNKDIYEGGSKMVAILQTGIDADKESIHQQLYKLQFGFINAFFDLFVTENGKAKDPRVIDYYAEDEPIELGPDENMHDAMVEIIAKQGIKRGYILGAGVISSKQIGINHKEYGVTSIGVMRFAEVTMASLGIDMHKDAFSVKYTGGPNGDVAGNGLRLLQERCPLAKVKLIVDGSGAVYDPDGLEKVALSNVILKLDIDGYDPEALHPNGFIIYRSQTKVDGMTTRFKKLTMTEQGLEEEWVSTDNFYKTYNSLLFTVETDLFIPAGGRPETIDSNNVDKYFNQKGEPSSKAIVEGANSFITPDARIELQRRGVVIIRDASANKCGVISSSYEIIANLLLSDEEFLANKDNYVKDVIDILNQMAEREANLIIKRHDESNGGMYYTEASNSISREINAHYTRIFEYFQENPELVNEPQYQNAMLLHMPKLIGSTEQFKSRIQKMPEKVKFAILASKLSSSMVYDGDDNSIYGGMIKAQISSFPDFQQTKM
ncbi:MAG: NAD-glutamate dehydrogenase domain-containing protein [Cocleimonas sp.]